MPDTTLPVLPVDLPAGAVARYARHLSLPGIGLVGQQRLAGTRVLCIGAGGLGSPVLQYLAAAGVGTLGIVDDDVVDLSNLQRQIIHPVTAVGTPKVHSAAEFIANLNPLVAVRTFDTRLTRDTIGEILDGLAPHIVVDGSDNFATRYLVADTCADRAIPLVWGSISRFSGQVSVFDDGHTLRDLYPEPPAPGTVPTCAEGGVFGVLPGVIGTIMATEVIKLVTGTGTPLVGRLALWDGADATMRTVRFEPQPGSAALRHTTPPDDGVVCTPAPALTPDGILETPVSHWPELAGEGVRLVDVREPHEWAGGVLGDPLRLPLSTLKTGDLGVLEHVSRETPLAVYCAAGVRSRAAALLLGEAGFRDVVSLSGGINAWWLRR
ncbi:ThiF family adenylyltransferase [Corynebacterium sp. CCM 9185]|uniref:ThiF family adenylyltransferase n=1 Tax=Corynebacterium marambiense TaxID=2765364 RepID=A0ABS0W205_9CORY|nr:ThiF family adenylyltransferase [Corynebacterium marambiense]MBI9001632.1 ThiF family adenylyltransferase [Corynebacterium marambiense]MCK7662097.1 ThiF family adenylyltransferase [Corynebacterium marambiense]